MLKEWKQEEVKDCRITIYIQMYSNAVEESVGDKLSGEKKISWELGVILHIVKRSLFYNILMFYLLFV